MTSSFTGRATLNDSIRDSSKYFSFRRLLAFYRSNVSDVPGTAYADSEMLEISPREPLQCSSPGSAVLGATNNSVPTEDVRSGTPASLRIPLGHAAVFVPAAVFQAFPSYLAPGSPRSLFAHESVMVSVPVLRFLPSSVAFSTANTVSMRSLLYMDAIRPVCM